MLMLMILRDRDLMSQYLKPSALQRKRKYYACHP